MPDFSALLSRPAGKAIKPPILPVELYPAIVHRFEHGDQNRQRTPYVRFLVGLTDWPESIPPGSPDRQYLDADGNSQEIDLSRRQFHADFYITEDALGILDDFLRSCGINLTGLSYNEAVPQVVGAQCLARVGQYINESTGERANARRLDALIGTAREQSRSRTAAA